MGYLLSSAQAQSSMSRAERLEYLKDYLDIEQQSLDLFKDSGFKNLDCTAIERFLHGFEEKLGFPAVKCSEQDAVGTC